MMQRWQWVLMAILSMIGMCGCNDEQARRMKLDHQRAVYESLSLQEELQQHGNGYSSADMGIGISNQGMRNLLSLLKGMKVAPTTPPKGIEDISVVIEGVELIAKPGRSEMELAVAVISPSNHLKLDATVTGDLLFMPPAMNSEIIEDQLAFRLKLKEMKPSLSWYLLRLRTTAVMREYITYKLAEQLESSLVLKVPTVKLDKLLLGLEGVEVVKNDKTGFQAQIGYSSPKFVMPVVARYSQFIMAESGIWVFGRYAAKSPYVPKSIDQVTADKLESEVARLTNKIQTATATLSFSSGDSAIFVSGRLIEKITSQITARSTEERTISFKSTENRGKLFEDKWRDNILGDGGIYVELDGNDAIFGKATLTTATSSWGDKGLSYSATTDVSTSTKVHAHFDPLLGGGIGARFTLDGSASPTVSGTMSFSIRAYAGVPTLVAENQLNCSKFPLTVIDRGDLKIGVTVSQVVGGGKSSVIPMVIGVPQTFNAAEILGGIEAARVTPPEAFAAITYAPTQIKKDAAGLHAEFSIRAAWSAADGGAAEAKTKEIRTLAKQDSLSQADSKCSNPDSMVVHIAGMDFGKNNEFVKAINFLVEGAKAGSKIIEDTLSTSARNLLNPPSDTAMHKPLHKPVDTIICIATFFHKCK